MRSLATIVLAGACATPHVVDPYKADVDAVIAKHPPSSKTIPEPATLATKPWKVGQWALYEHQGPDGHPAYQRIRVVGEGSCGTWIAAEARTYRAHYKWRMCVHPVDHTTGSALDLVQVFIIQNDGAPKTIDVHSGDPRAKHDREGFVAGLLPPHIADGDPQLVREDVDVPAGHFVRVVRETLRVDDGGEATRWFSPDVPFDGTIKRHTRTFDFVLLAYGDSSTPDESDDL
ncbi:MAG TPA: hypothetical protein VFQ65_31805 [Kofleriaceae bacterium]|nr:hypothetical protein [Kofleriaceae bacterium]